MRNPGLESRYVRAVCPTPMVAVLQGGFQERSAAPCWSQLLARTIPRGGRRYRREHHGEITRCHRPLFSKEPSGCTFVPLIDGYGASARIAANKRTGPFERQLFRNPHGAIVSESREALDRAVNWSVTSRKQPFLRLDAAKVERRGWPSSRACSH